MAETTVSVKVNKLAATIATLAIFGRFIEPGNDQDLREHIDAAYGLGYWPIFAAADDWSGLQAAQEKVAEVGAAGGDVSEVIGLATAKFIADYHGLIGLEHGRKATLRDAKEEAAKSIDFCPEHGSHHQGENETGDDVRPGDLADVLKSMGAEVKVVKVGNLSDIDSLDLPQDVKDAIRSQLEDLQKQPGSIN